MKNTPSLGSSDPRERAAALRYHASRGGPNQVQEALDRLDSLPGGPDRFGRFTGLGQPKKCPACGAVNANGERLLCEKCGRPLQEPL